jgi:predicted nucleotide-binding protein
MAGVGEKLLNALERKLGLSRSQVNRRILDEATTKHLPRKLAAISLASQNRLPIHRFATDDELAQLRGLPAPSRSAVATAIPDVPMAAVRSTSRAVSRPIKTTKNNTIFVVHGRDRKLNEDMFNFLRALGLNAVEFAQAIADTAGPNPNITKIVKGALKRAQGVLVMFSPDEEARLKAKHRGDRDSTKLEGQSRLNVIFEAGIALGAHPEKTLLIEVGHVRNVSDIAGMHIPRLTNDPTSRKELAERLRKKLRLKVNTTGDYWLQVGNFSR